MTTEAVVDTNVLAISEKLHDGASDGCVKSCVELARQIHDGQIVVLLDETDEILVEYLRYLNHEKSSAVGTKIAQLLRTRKHDPKVCRQVAITRSSDNSGSYNEVPDSVRDFDSDDQKFLAIAVASEVKPKIYAGLDGEWWDRSDDLLTAGFDVQFRCSSDLIARDAAEGA